jgi:uncharacterized protein DUF2017
MSRGCTPMACGRRCRKIADVARTRVFRRGEGPTLVVTLHEDEVALLRELARDVREFVVAPADSGPVSERLYPTAYLDPTEESAEARWQGQSHGELVSSRLAALDALTTTLDSGRPKKRGGVEITLDADGEAQWLGVLNDARLIVGTAAGITEDDDPADIAVDPHDARAQLLRMYAWLTELQADLVDVLLGDLAD